MLEIKDKNTLSGIIPPSDCERNFNVKWLSGTPTGSFYIGDSQTEKEKIAKFITGKHKCKIDMPSFRAYAHKLKQIVTKFKNMFYGPVNIIDENLSFFNCLPENEQYIMISYDPEDRYLKTSKHDHGVREFKCSLAPNITYLEIKKTTTNEYIVYVKIIDSWRKKIMKRSNKCDVDSMVNMFNEFMSEPNREQEDLARLFGIKYALLLNNNNIKVNELVSKSNFNNENIVKSLQNGMLLSKDIIWETEDEFKDNSDVIYQNFQHLVNWFVTQLNINNDIPAGEKHSGKGHKGDAIQNLYKDWRIYDDFTLDCTIQTGFNSASSNANYINKSGSGINIRPIFSTSKKVIDLYIDLYNIQNYNNNENVKAICDKRYEISMLGLNDMKPNDLLKNLFNDYVTIIKLLSNIKIKYRIENFDSSFERNRIIFGAPGTGKSYKLNESIKDFAENTYERVTFHPDYTYANFVGTYKPVPDKNNPKDITYKYVPGPFMRTLVKALKSINDPTTLEEYKNKPYVLVIEEINRANVAAVFGEVFQLLDRDSNGESKYAINTSEDIKDYLVEEFGGQPEDFNTIKIPNNMFIGATMNSADQGVFPIDTAFKRRWNFEYIGINENDDEISDYEIKFANKSFKWNNLRISINNFLAKNRVNEDKLIGPFFIDIDTLKDETKFIKTFKDKVIMYLFEDAGRQLRNNIFVNEGNSPLLYSKICEKFDKDGISIFNNEIQGGIENVE